MDSKKFTVGDWFYNRNLHCRSQFGPLDYDYFDWECCPILLSYGILSENGWHYIKSNGYSYYKHKDVPFVILASDFIIPKEDRVIFGNDVFGTPYIIVGHVHLLQQALRLFGKRDIADSFKVTAL